MDGDNVPRLMPLHLLEEITNGFCNDRKVGAGSYGNVYKGEHKNGETIAVKLLHYIPGLDDDQFKKEYLNVASLQHKNIVRLVGYCNETQVKVLEYNGEKVFAEVNKKALCFEYMHNGSLDKYLCDEVSGLEWRTRYAIIKGICHGLKYLHEELQPPMFHLDLKPGNVLLDENMVPKLADFGLSRLFGEQTQRTTSAIGTLGYVPPECIHNGIISNKFDVFSLGVVFIKIITGPTGNYRSEEMSPHKYIELVHTNWKKRLDAGSVHQRDSYSEQVKKCIEIALSCVDGDRNKRPTIGVIISKLNETETMSESPDMDIGSSIYKVCRCISTESVLMDISLHKLRSYPLNVTDNRGRLHETMVSTICKREDDTTFEPIPPKIEIIHMEDYLDRVLAIDVHPMEPWILVGHQSGKVSIWNNQTQVRLMVLDFTYGRGCKILAVKFIPRAQCCITGDKEGGIHVYTFTTKDKLTEFEFDAHTDRFNSLDPTDPFRLSWSLDGQIILRSVQAFIAHHRDVTSLAVHPADPFVLSSSSDFLIKLWNWEEDWTCIRTFHGHHDLVRSVKFNPLAATNTFASASWDGTVKIWNMFKNYPITRLKCRKDDRITSVDYFIVRGNQEYIVACSVDGTAHIWDLESKTCIRHVEGLQKQSSGVSVVDRLPGNPILVTVSEDQKVSFCNSTTHRYQNTVDFNLEYIEDIAYIKATRSLVVACQQGIAIMETS